MGVSEGVALTCALSRPTQDLHRLPRAQYIREAALLEIIVANVPSSRTCAASILDSTLHAITLLPPPPLPTFLVDLHTRSLHAASTPATMKPIKSTTEVPIGDGNDIAIFTIAVPRSLDKHLAADFTSKATAAVLNIARECSEPATHPQAQPEPSAPRVKRSRSEDADDSKSAIQDLSTAKRKPSADHIRISLDGMTQRSVQFMVRPNVRAGKLLEAFADRVGRPSKMFCMSYDYNRVDLQTTLGKVSGLYRP